MPRVLIFGATGYVGRQVAGLLVQSGQHYVYGVARTQAKALLFQREEIIPVLCSDPANNPESYLSTIRSGSIDIRLGEERIESWRGKGIVNGPKLGYIYCSGTWVHGSSERPVTDLDLVGPDSQTPPEELSAWRVALEKEVLASSDILDVMIIRPALVYGRESTIWAPYFMPVLQAARNKTLSPIEIPLVENSRPGLIHVDDVATAFQKAVERLPMIAGVRIYPVFDLVTSQESMRGIFDALALCSGYAGTIQLVGHGGDSFSKAMSATFNGTSARAELLLEWRPRRLGGFRKDMSIYAMAFEASL
ncbi:hypothetical protein DPV78_001801 [Talaromyces pinophilus]|nr:hypothetical protein DPV78_001801 [Talaromyces pinophilus]